jgi:hypothetical protein
VCTYPEALAETVTGRVNLDKQSLHLHRGDAMKQTDLVAWLEEHNFVRVEFVYEPGQYSVRGGLVDIFSYAESRPYRVDFFGDEIDSIRRFNISSQLSHDKTDEVEIVPNMNSTDVEKVSLVRFAGDATCWFYDADFVLKRVNDLRRRLLGEMEEPSKIDTLMTSRNGLLKDMAEGRMFLLRDNLKERVADVTVTFSTTPQPKFNKNFEVLADDLSDSMRSTCLYMGIFGLLTLLFILTFYLFGDSRFPYSKELHCRLEPTRDYYAETSLGQLTEALSAGDEAALALVKKTIMPQLVLLRYSDSMERVFYSQLLRQEGETLVPVTDIFVSKTKKD